MAFGLVHASAQSVYRYKDDLGHWHFTDRQPDEPVEQLEHERRRPGRKPAAVVLTQAQDERGLVITARNDYFCPVHLVYTLVNTLNVPGTLLGTQQLVLQANQKSEVVVVPLAANGETRFEVSYQYLPGDPGARHAPQQPYRAPFAVSSDYRISQAYPDMITHTTPGSRHAVDIALPEGTPVYAARGGMVFDVAYDSYSGGTTEADRAKANLVRILHDDGTMAVYAHLAWNAIRVRPGTRVERGEYIANSGNTGFSTGPHLHFGVQRNDNGQVVSVPVTFEGSGGIAIAPESGKHLKAY